MKRTTRTKPTVVVDLAIPVDKGLLMSTGNGCFGKLFDITSSECPKCADRELCHIIYKDSVDEKAIKISKEKGVVYLDLSDFDNLNGDKIFDWIESGTTTTKELIKHVGAKANTDDRVAVVEWIKNFVKSDKRLYTKSGIVWKR